MLKQLAPNVRATAVALAIAFAAALALIGCGSEKSSGPSDTTPPARVTDLRVEKFVPTCP
ncbi:MAG TPA: hypothetical protein VMU02_08040 [bacterium]|nr:hypothetical protein [bacterium]